MLKFQFNYQQNTLTYQAPFSEYWSEVEDQFEGNFGSQGFQLPDGWITFTIYANKIRGFYKQMGGSSGLRRFLRTSVNHLLPKGLA